MLLFRSYTPFFFIAKTISAKFDMRKQKEIKPIFGFYLFKITELRNFVSFVYLNNSEPQYNNLSNRVCSSLFEINHKKYKVCMAKLNRFLAIIPMPKTEKKFRDIVVTQ